MSTWFQVTNWSMKIVPVEVVKESPKQITTVVPSFNGGTRTRRAFKNGSYDHYFKTFDEAKEHLVKRSQARLESAKRALATAESELKTAQEFTCPSL